MIDWPTVVAGLMAANVDHALEADIVFVGWLDQSLPRGVGYLLLKGERLMGELSQRGDADSSFQVTAHHDGDGYEISLVRVDGYAEALALLKKVRDGSNGGD